MVTLDPTAPARLRARNRQVCTFPVIWNLQYAWRGITESDKLEARSELHITLAPTLRKSTRLTDFTTLVYSLQRASAKPPVAGSGRLQNGERILRRWP